MSNDDTNAIRDSIVGYFLSQRRVVARPDRSRAVKAELKRRLKS